MLKSVNFGKLEAINKVVEVSPGLEKEFDAISDNTVFEAKFHITLKKLYQQVLGETPVKLSHLKVLSDRKFSNIRNLVYQGENEGGNTVKAVIEFLKHRPEYLKEISVTDKGMSIKIALADMKDFLFNPDIISLFRNEGRSGSANYIPKNIEYKHAYMEKLIDNKLKQLKGDKFDVIIAVSNALPEDMETLNDMISVKESQAEDRSQYAQETQSISNSLSGVNFWLAVGVSLMVNKRIYDPFVKEVNEYASGRAAGVIAHDLAVKAVGA